MKVMDLLDKILLAMNAIFAALFLASQVKTPAQSWVMGSSGLILVIALYARYCQARKDFKKAFENFLDSIEAAYK